MLRIAMMVAASVLLHNTHALAITQDEIPPDLQNRLPEFFQFIPPPVLERLELIDLEDYAASYQAGELYTIGEVRVVEQSGPIEPEVAQAMLGVIPGIPFSPRRFDRVAKQFYGLLIFSRLEWNLRLDEDGIVDVELFYDSNSPQLWIPRPSYSPVAGVLLGGTYRDMRYGDENKQLVMGLQFNEEDPGTPAVDFSWTDNTLNDGRESLTVSTSVENVWRKRLKDSPEQSDIRLRTGKLDLDYAWKDAAPIGDYNGTIGIGAGIYHQDYHLYSGNPSGSPRATLDQDGAAGFYRLRWSSEEKDHVLAPRDGYSYSAAVERHFGDFEFTHLKLDLRQYHPAKNILGYQAEESCPSCRNNVRRLLPGASLVIQAQANITDRDVPFTFETRLGDADYMRGPEKDTVVGSKLLAARAEYRFAADRGRNSEVILFTDHAWLGEEFGDLESHSSIGTGLLYSVPALGGFQLGVWYGTSLTGEGDEFGFLGGYQF